MTPPTMFDDRGEPTPLARLSDPDSSHAAARSVTGLRDKQRAVLDALVACGGLATDEQIAVRYVRDGYPPQSDSGLRTRRAELVRAGLVKDSGVRAKLRTGRKAVLWAVVR